MQDLSDPFKKNYVITGRINDSICGATSDDLDSLSVSDIREAMVKCEERISLLSKTKNQTLKEIISATIKASDDTIKKYAGNLITFARYCHARASILQPASSGNNIYCSSSPELVMHQYKTYSKDILRQIYKQNPETLGADIEWEARNLLPMEFLPQQNNNLIVINEFIESTSYCPNKTAEFIEDLVKANPCIKHVYIPSNWVTKKLNHLGAKILFQRFEKNDRYLVEYGDSSCK